MTGKGKQPPAPAGLPWPTPGRRIWKVDGVPIATAASIVSVTIPRGGLGRWGARTAAHYAVTHWAALGQVPESDREAAIAAAPFDRAEIVPRGSDIRELLARTWLTGAPPREQEASEEVRPQWRAASAWLASHRVEPLAWARVAYDPNPRRRYVAEVDLIARVDGSPPLIIAVETGATVHPEVRLRLAAARYAPLLLTADGRDTQPWPAVRGASVLHIQAAGVAFEPVTAGPTERACFRACHRVHRWVRTNTTSHAAQ